MDIPTKKHKIIIVDDDDEYGSLLKETLEDLGHIIDCVNNLESAKYKIRLAHEKDEPYSIATIDRNFKVGGRRTEFASGIVVLSFIKKNYPNIACIMISGHAVSPDEVLDLRDHNNLDYYLQKDRVDPGTLNKAIETATQRVQPRSLVDRIRVLRDSLAKLYDTQARIRNNLFYATERAAKKGIDVDPTTRSEIDQYEQDLERTKADIKATEIEIERLEKEQTI